VARRRTASCCLAAETNGTGPQHAALCNRLCRRHEFPRPVPLSRGCVGFPVHEALPALPTAAVTPAPAGEDIGFVTEGAGTTLLVLGSDGRFTRYSRLENETKQTDAGESRRLSADRAGSPQPDDRSGDLLRDHPEKASRLVGSPARGALGCVVAFMSDLT
jgi:hypothetical protein